MHIRKYDFDYGRRALLEKVAKGTMSAGVLASAWPLLAEGQSAEKAYPEELVSIEANTKGKVKPGDVITADNVDHVKHLLAPTVYEEVKNQGRQFHIVEPVKDVSRMFPPAYLEATLRNQGRAVFDKNNNVIDKKTGGPWIGGSPFPDPQSALEACADLTLSWGRHNYSQYAMRAWDMDPGGSPSYTYDFGWGELNTTARTDGSVFQGMDDMLRLQSLWFTSPADQAGTSFLSEWHYDQRKFPELYGYLPLFRRVRQFPTTQRFEPLVPGISLFLSDAWAAGDPMLTWGNYKVVGREPHLVAINPKNWGATWDSKNWEPPVHGGPHGRSFFDSYLELCPETVVFEAEPTGYPRAPVGKKKIWVDVRNAMIVSYITYDRRGDVWKSLQPSFGPRETINQDGERVAMETADGKVDWSWSWVIIHDMQSNRITLLSNVKQIEGGYRTDFRADEQEAYGKFLTRAALTRLGQV